VALALFVFTTPIHKPASIMTLLVILAFRVVLDFAAPETSKCICEIDRWMGKSAARKPRRIR
jgi:hypothetical protein